MAHFYHHFCQPDHSDTCFCVQWSMESSVLRRGLHLHWCELYRPQVNYAQGIVSLIIPKHSLDHSHRAPSPNANIKMDGCLKEWVFLTGCNCMLYILCILEIHPLIFWSNLQNWQELNCKGGLRVVIQVTPPCDSPLNHWAPSLGCTGGLPWGWILLGYARPKQSLFFLHQDYTLFMLISTGTKQGLHSCENQTLRQSFVCSVVYILLRIASCVLHTQCCVNYELRL